ncbi:MAG TPA: pyridoxamine 5'-phosphate oxidase family protein [Pseudonocardia sp.]|jgi:hypothetical protein
MVGSTFHSGELAVQARAGLREQAERVGGIVGATVPPVAAAFLARQPMLVVGGADGDGRMWASLLTGEPGFLRAGVVGGRDVVDVAARPLPGDPLAAALTGPVRLGTIALEPAGRRRMRVNGVAEPTASGLRLTVDQAYANCPKYIQAREVRERAESPAGDTVESTVLDTASVAMISRADTFFIATGSATGDRDASHRGGNPGFVRVAGDGTLSWADYPGNAMMMTLGNLEQEPATGLLVVDWTDGTTLQVSGRGWVEWEGAERTVRVRPERVRRVPGGSPLRWGPPEYSRFNPA